ncbi:MAG TPA: endo-1,4-beta-xylanase [Candidatus Eisenbergiella merdipullorum]|uniref:Endo-1,4-beta-xylanase n=1 Tax=Candidatus Eisenbergiella merdipullorum TaxID=2838553 RepID=A0A9D2I877_9FIRM|nr:endo-1,4-beta-xylanase [Candidatus Eisenbergiella merdipullorum]
MAMTIKEKREICLSKFEEKRAETEKRTSADIEKYRKGRCRIQLKDQNGNPVVGKKIRVCQKTHDFKYGANIFMLDGFEKKEDNEAYREIFSRYFNLATIPFYWQGLEPEKGKPRYAADSVKVPRRPAPDLCLDYCQEKGIAGKLHCLFYESFLPDWLPKQDAAAMWKYYEKRFSEIAERYSGKLYEVEVINEMLCESGWKTQSVLCGERDIVERCFALASKYFTDDTLVINEANQIPLLAKQDYRNAYFMQLDMLLSHGTPIDKIGVQNHIFTGAAGPQEETIREAEGYFDPENIFRGLDVLAALGKPLEITEVTIPTLGDTPEDEELQAELLKEMYTIWFSIPSMRTIVYWNTVEGTAHATPNWNENNCRGGLFHRDFTPKKSGQMLKKLFDEVWHTELELVTDEHGIVDFRGFYGEYTLDLGTEMRSFGIHKDVDAGNEIIVP